MERSWKTRLAFVAFVACALIACQRNSQKPPAMGGTVLQGPPGTYKLKIPLGLDATSATVYIPEDNPLTESKIKLGRLLFFDRRLSADGMIACSSCHVPEAAFSDPDRFSRGVDGHVGTRQAPTLINRLFSRAQFWDGRSASLEDQVLVPLTNPIEMANHSMNDVVRRLQGIPEYLDAFAQAFPEDTSTGKADEMITSTRIGQAVASFERTILSGNSPFDRFSNGDQTAIDESAKRGYRLFFGRALCSQCHLSFNFTDELYHNLGTGTLAKNPDLGRYLFAKTDGQQGAFKTPTMREIFSTAPYMSDGSLSNLDKVIEFYDKGGQPNPWLSQKLKPLKLTTQDEADLMAFMKSLSGEVTWYGKMYDFKNRPFIMRTQSGS
jgi:cytochrome c peroxidase